MPYNLPLAGEVVLIVEDRYFLANDLARCVEMAGAAVEGPAGLKSASVELILTGHATLAVLDLQLHGEDTMELADLLASRAVPFVFYSGRNRSEIAERWSAVALLTKPQGPEAVVRALIELAAGRGIVE